jgi:7-cyano-7-deazaguanine synthase in queuosine biosynthesis
MKLTINNYNLSKDNRLKIDIVVEGTTINTGVVIDMSNLAFFVNKVPDSLLNFLYLSAIAYGIDRTFNRGLYSIDGWSREFDVDVEFKDNYIFENNREVINSLLSFLTGDFWNIHFLPKEREIDYPFVDIPELNNDINQVNLFSGGMDSLIGAIDYMATNRDRKLCLTSHYDHYMKGTKNDQNLIRDHFYEKYPNRFFHLPSVHIYPLISKETTCRSRSLMFMAIALLVAQYKSVGVIVPENGSVSLNYPLSVSRRAACSTRTTHALFINQLKVLLYNLGINIQITNPYEFKTKGIMVNECADREFLLNVLKDSNSCGKRTTHQYMYDNPLANHCGRCMPCMYRRAALLGYDDQTTYGIKMETLFHKKDKELSNDFFAMLSYLKRDLTPNDIRRELRIAGLGKLPNFENYIALVQQTREELIHLIRNENIAEINTFIGL